MSIGESSSTRISESMVSRTWSLTREASSAGSSRTTSRLRRPNMVVVLDSKAKASGSSSPLSRSDGAKELRKVNALALSSPESESDGIETA